MSRYALSKFAKTGHAKPKSLLRSMSSRLRSGRSYRATLEALSALSRSFATPGAFYVLGAGASVPYVPITAKLSEKLLERFFRHGSFVTDPIARDEVSKRVIQEPDFWDDPVKRELAQRMPPNYVIAKLPELLVGPSEIPIANYEVFNLAASPSVLFTLNVDGLAKRICTTHVVLEAHGGNLARADFRSRGWNRHIEATLDFPELAPIRVRGQVLPGPEPADVRDRQEYRCAAELLPRSRYVSIIGYSFGAMDDVYTYEFLTSTIPSEYSDVIVISPDPYDLMHQIADRLKSPRVHAMAASWTHLARAILRPGCCRKHHQGPRGAFCVSCIWYQHEALLDAFPY